MSWAAATAAIRDYLVDNWPLDPSLLSLDGFGSLNAADGGAFNAPAPIVGGGDPTTTRWGRVSRSGETEIKSHGGYGPTTEYQGVIVVQLFSSGSLDEQTSELDVLADAIADLLHYATVGPVQFEAAQVQPIARQEGAATHQINVIGIYTRLNAGYLVTSARRYLEVSP